MKILAFDTSSIACSVALLNTEKSDGVKTISLHQVAPMQQGRLILPMIQTVLDQSALQLNQLDAIAFGCGPGSFTGIRIASCVAQGLGFATHLPLIPVSSMAAIAQTAYLEYRWTSLLVALDARMGQVYWGAYQINTDGIAELIGQERACETENINIPVHHEWYGVGDGWSLYEAKLNTYLGFEPKGVQSALHPNACAVLDLARTKFEQGGWVINNEALPVYLR